jgi:hypothetical protein
MHGKKIHIVVALAPAVAVGIGSLLPGLAAATAATATAPAAPAFLRLTFLVVAAGLGFRAIRAFRNGLAVVVAADIGADVSAACIGPACAGLADGLLAVVMLFLDRRQAATGGFLDAFLGALLAGFLAALAAFWVTLLSRRLSR